MKNIELKPCPFCGGKAGIVTTVICYTPRAYVKCKECNTTTQTFSDCDHDGSYIFSACEAWNRRVTE